MAGTGRNLTDSLRFREATALFLNLHGHDDATAKPMRTRISERIGVSSSDVAGVDGWHIATSSRASFRIGGDLDAAHAEADDDQLVCLVQHRRERSLGDSLVVLTLEDFARLTAPPPP